MTTDFESLWEVNLIVAIAHPTHLEESAIADSLGSPSECVTILKDVKLIEPGDADP